MQHYIDQKTQNLIREYVPQKSTLRALADFFGTLGDSTRIKLLSALSICPMCVSDITKTLGMNQTTVSHQLKNLRDMSIVDYDRKGKVLIYYIKESKVLDVLLKAVEML